MPRPLLAPETFTYLQLATSTDQSVSENLREVEEYVYKDADEGDDIYLLPLTIKELETIKLSLQELTLLNKAVGDTTRVEDTGFLHDNLPDLPIPPPLSTPTSRSTQELRQALEILKKKRDVSVKYSHNLWSSRQTEQFFQSTIHSYDIQIHTLEWILGANTSLSFPT